MPSGGRTTLRMNAACSRPLVTGCSRGGDRRRAAVRGGEGRSPILELVRSSHPAIRHDSAWRRARQMLRWHCEAGRRRHVLYRVRDTCADGPADRVALDGPATTFRSPVSWNPAQRHPRRARAFARAGNQGSMDGRSARAECGLGSHGSSPGAGRRANRLDRLRRPRRAARRFGEVLKPEEWRRNRGAEARGGPPHRGGSGLERPPRQLLPRTVRSLSRTARPGAHVVGAISRVVVTPLLRRFAACDRRVTRRQREGRRKYEHQPSRRARAGGSGGRALTHETTANTGSPAHTAPCPTRPKAAWGQLVHDASRRCSAPRAAIQGGMTKARGERQPASGRSPAPRRPRPRPRGS